jgi:small-conductance mechanosensitive channel
MRLTTHRHASGAPPSAGDPLHEENVRLVHRLQQLRAALEASARDNAQLRRSLAQARTENQQLRAQLTPPAAHHDRGAHIRAMLRDPGSRNP